MGDIEIIKLTAAQAENIGFDFDKLPIGAYYFKDRNVWIAIDNNTGEAWTEEFTNLRSCKRWLRGGAVANAQGFIV